MKLYLDHILTSISCNELTITTEHKCSLGRGEMKINAPISSMKNLIPCTIYVPQLKENAWRARVEETIEGQKI